MIGTSQWKGLSTIGCHVPAMLGKMSTLCRKMDSLRKSPKSFQLDLFLIGEFLSEFNSSDSERK